MELNPNDAFFNDTESLRKAKELIEQDWFKKFIKCVSSNMFPYDRERESEHIHIHSENIGGCRAHRRFVRLLFTIPNIPDKAIEEDESLYVGFADPNSLP